MDDFIEMKSDLQKQIKITHVHIGRMKFPYHLTRSTKLLTVRESCCDFCDFLYYLKMSQ